MARIKSEAGAMYAEMELRSRFRPCTSTVRPIVHFLRTDRAIHAEGTDSSQISILRDRVFLVSPGFA